MIPNKRLLSFTLALIVFVVMLPDLALSAGEDYEINSLKGIKKVAPIVTLWISDNDNLSSLKNTLITQVELKLRLANIDIISTDEPAINADAILMIEISIIQTDEPPNSYYAFSFLMDVMQQTKLFRDDSIFTLGSTWATSNMVVNTREQEFESTLRIQIDRYIDQFLNDYLKANPR